jgi:hypothetical protein
MIQICFTSRPITLSNTQLKHRKMEKVESIFVFQSSGKSKTAEVNHSWRETHKSSEIIQRINAPELH